MAMLHPSAPLELSILFAENERCSRKPYGLQHIPRKPALPIQEPLLASYSSHTINFDCGLPSKVSPNPPFTTFPLYGHLVKRSSFLDRVFSDFTQPHVWINQSRLEKPLKLPVSPHLPLAVRGDEYGGKPSAPESLEQCSGYVGRRQVLRGR